MFKVGSEVINYYNIYYTHYNNTWMVQFGCVAVVGQLKGYGHCERGHAKRKQSRVSHQSMFPKLNVQ